MRFRLFSIKSSRSCGQEMAKLRSTMRSSGSQLLCFFFFRAAPAAYGDSQARSNWRYSCWPTPQPQHHQISRVCDLHYSSQQCWILNPLNKARDRTQNFSGLISLHQDGNSPASILNPTLQSLCLKKSHGPQAWAKLEASIVHAAI